jgi:hypothetical protein
MRKYSGTARNARLQGAHLDAQPGPLRRGLLEIFSLSMRATASMFFRLAGAIGGADAGHFAHPVQAIAVIRQPVFKAARMPPFDFATGFRFGTCLFAPHLQHVFTSSAPLLRAGFHIRSRRCLRRRGSRMWS